MDSPTVRRAVVALLVALTLAAVAWAIRTLVEAFALLHNALVYPLYVNAGPGNSDDRIRLVFVAAGIVVVLAIVGYIVFSKWRDAVEYDDEQEFDVEEEAFDDDEEIPRD
ncbi:MAG: hypothetical protein F4X54_00050 [Chloroflexi bacterium]|nr:hypothetical protein [Chloroflexota bacterium]MYB83145.1 hypothetical protein [Chloroflexota bacterium]